MGRSLFHRPGRAKRLADDKGLLPDILAVIPALSRTVPVNGSKKDAPVMDARLLVRIRIVFLAEHETASQWLRNS
ncbi:hypothetical protein [Agrobacterium fabrum]|uniref:hypothetical protein n=1 Tax=Agrobacterium fabrum TaxID=1176649 RepID=UPI003BA1B88D